jgi:hypothetical protein
METSPKCLRPLRNPKVRYDAHKSSHFILSHMNPIPTLILHFIWIRFSSTLPCMTSCPIVKWTVFVPRKGTYIMGYGVKTDYLINSMVVERESSTLLTLNPVTWRYPEPDTTSSHLHGLFLEIHLNRRLPFRLLPGLKFIIFFLKQ